jgi:hypothetical protein
MTLLNKRLLFILISIGALLSIPLIAMQFTEEVNWSPLDFLIMGFLLLIVGIIIELVFRKVRKNGHRFLILLGILLVFFLIWAELAVGIFGTPFAGS